MTNSVPLTSGIFIDIATGSPTTVHMAPAADPGRHRGSIIEITFMNSNSASREVTLRDGTHTEIFIVLGKSVQYLKFWQGAGTTLSAQASGSDVVAAGLALEI